MIQSAKDLHHSILSAARRRNEKEHDIEDPREFEQFADILEELGHVAQNAEKKSYPPELVGRTMQFYSKCIAASLPKGLVPSGS